MDTKHYPKMVALLSLLAIPDHAATSATPTPSPSPSPSPSVVYIDPTNKDAGTGTLNDPFKSWASVKPNINGVIHLQAGTSYLQKAGTRYSGVLVITGQGTQAKPIVIGSYGGQERPTLNTVDIESSAYVEVIGIGINGSTYSGIIIENGSHNITLQNNWIMNAPLGIIITNGAGGSNLITGNLLMDNQTFGIGIAMVSNTPGTETVISDNNIFDNGSHGIELEGNYFIVKGNLLSGNGGRVSGSSGIHLYGGGANGSVAQNTGSYNQVLNNTSINNEDNGPDALSPGQDGNGIELDQYTHDNTVSGNFLWQNNGTGLTVWDSYNNTITNNYSMSNGRDSNGAHLYRTEYLLGTASASINLTKNNSISGNTGVATTTTNYAVVIDVPTSQNKQVYGKNTLSNTSGGHVSLIDGVSQ